MAKYLDDVLIFAGCGVIVYATYLLDGIAALYAGGVLLILMGVYVGISNDKVKK